MAIRKPSLSVQEARHLAKTRNAALDSDLPSPPLATKLNTSQETSASTPPAQSGSSMRATTSLLDGEHDPTTQVFLSAPLPSAGVSKSFDFLSKQYPPDKALRMILRRALDDYEAALEAARFDTLPANYTVQNASAKVAIIQTSRMMPITLLKRARAHFDPLGFESDRAFGRKLACAALAAFFAAEVKR